MPQRRADAEQAGLRAQMPGQRVPFRPADRAEQYRAAGFANANGLLRQRNAGRVDGAAAHEYIVKTQCKAESLCRNVERLDGFPDDLGADSISSNHRNVIVHRSLPPYSLPVLMAFISPPADMIP